MKQKLKILFNIVIVTIVSVAIVGMSLPDLQSSFNEFTEKESEEEIFLSSDIDYELSDLAFSGGSTKLLSSYSFNIHNSFSVFFSTTPLVIKISNYLLSIVTTNQNPYYLQYCSLLVYS